MNRGQTIEKDLTAWMSVSREAVDKLKRANQSRDLVATRQRTETLLTLSKSLRSLSSRTRAYAEAARENVRPKSPLI